MGLVGGGGAKMGQRGVSLIVLGGESGMWGRGGGEVVNRKYGEERGGGRGGKGVWG